MSFSNQNDNTQATGTLIRPEKIGTFFNPRRLSTTQIFGRNAICHFILSTQLKLPSLQKATGTDNASLSITDISPFSSTIHTKTGKNTLALGLSATQAPSSERFVLLIDAPFAHSLTDWILGRPPAPRVPFSIKPFACGFSQGEQGALLYAIEQIGADWISQGGHKFYIRGILAGPHQLTAFLGSSPQWQVNGYCQLGKKKGELILCTPEFTAHPVSMPATKLMPSPNTQLRQWFTELEVIVGHTTLFLRDIHSLAPGDVITLDYWAAYPFEESKSQPESNPVILANKTKSRYLATWQNRSRLKIISLTPPLDSKGDKMSETIENPIHSLIKSKKNSGKTNNMLNKADSIEVTVQVEAARISMKVNEAINLIPGQVIKLDKPIDAVVSLYIGDSFIGTGELVETDGQLAVQIREMS